MQYIVRLIPLRPTAICAGQLFMPRHKHLQLMLLLAHNALRL